jgi:hypothetical protein
MTFVIDWGEGLDRSGCTTFEAGRKGGGQTMRNDIQICIFVTFLGKLNSCLSIRMLHLQTDKTISIISLKRKFVKIIFKNSVRTAKKTPHFTITKINWLTLLKEMIAVYTENHTKHINTKRRATDC